MSRLTSPDKVLWPEVGLTKRDLADYFAAAAPRLLPQLAGRPLSLKRYPKGVDDAGFFQKDTPAHAPAAIGRWRQWAESANREVAYALVEDVEGLAWLAQQNTIELHPALFTVDRPDRVDQLVFDLDPGEAGPPATTAARWVREVLLELHLDPLVKTSGKRGLHVIVPIERRYPSDVVRALALAIGRVCVDRHPDDLTVQMRKAERGDRLLVDWSRSSIGATLVCAWSPRATPTASVATPLRWEEVTDDLDPAAFTITTVLERDDPWADRPAPQRLERATAAVEALGYELVDASPRARTPD